MGLDIVEATSGMGMHLKDIPPMILERQLKVILQSPQISLCIISNLLSTSGVLAYHPLL